MKRTLLALVSVAAIASAASAQTYRETVISYGVDGLPQTSTVVNATGPDSVTTFDWDEFGNLTNVSDATGRQVGATYDPMGRMLTMTGAAGTLEQTHTRYRYDANGRLQYADISSDGTATPPSWVTSEVTYHASGQAASVIDPAGDTQSFGYYNNGWLHTATDGEGRQTRNTYWDDGLLMSTYEAYGTAEATRTHLTWYDALGQREQLRPANGIGSAENASQGASWQPAYSSLWGFDAYSRVNGWSLPQQDDGTRLQEQYDYDAAGNMDERITRSGQTISIEHDASNRPWRKTTPEGVTVTTYNEAGEVRRITGPDQHSAGSWQLDYDYDFAGRMEYETITTPEGVARSVSYEYDAAGNRTRIIWPDGVSAEYIYDDANRIKEIWMDNADGSIKLRLASYDYDDQGRLDTYRLYRMTTNIAAEIGFGYQVDGDLETMAYTLETGPDFTATYDYDRAGWLTDRSIDNPSWDWTPSTSSVTLTSESYSRNRMDQYTAVSGQALSYDDNGNLTSDGSRSYVFSSENQLLSATTTSGTTDYSYGPAARRLRKATPDGAVTDFVLAGDMVIAEYVNGQLARRYLPGPGVDQRVAVIHCDTSTTCQAPDYANFRAHFYLPDRQGNVLATVGPFGDVQEQYHYTPFGVEMVGDPTGNPFRYTGRYFDAETGLYYYRARYYDSDLGRFLSVDPIGYADQLNLYAYVGNSPLNATDPTGMYGKGEGWVGRDSEWRTFEQAQSRALRRANHALSAVSRVRSRIESGSRLSARDNNVISLVQQATGQSFDPNDAAAFGAILADVESSLTSSISALSSDGSDGYLADYASARDMVDMGHDPTSNPASAELGGSKIMVHMDNTMWQNDAVSTWVLGHESFHSGPAGLVEVTGEVLVNGQPTIVSAYRAGTPEQIALFNYLRSNGHPATLDSADHLTFLTGLLWANRGATR